MTAAMVLQSPSNATWRYPRHVRASLERARVAGLGFEEAWGIAMATCGQLGTTAQHGPPCHVCGSDPTDCSDHEFQPEERFSTFFRRIMRAGYLRCDKRQKDMTVLVEDESAGHTFIRSRPFTVATPKCRWGDGCNTRVRNKRFCAPHTRILNRIKGELYSGATEEGAALNTQGG